MPIDFNRVTTPCYICEEAKLEANLQLLGNVQRRSGATILLALKGFAMWHTFDLVGRYLGGCSASGLHEAKLARETMNKAVHTYSPAFKEDEIDEIARISDHLIFNSFHQWKRFKKRVFEQNPEISCGIRVNPELSFAPIDLYNPCGMFSRLGVTVNNFEPEVLEGIEGLHFHALCEQDADALEGALEAFENRFGRWLAQMRWVNFGGGHHITREDYDTEKLVSLIVGFRQRYPHLHVYLEPGEAVGWQTGPLVASVLDLIENGMPIAILDISAEAHMPDTLAMPYRAEVRGAGHPHEKAHTYRLGGNTCLAGDVMGDYSFERPLKIGDKIVFEDQIHYTFVKSTTFNGVRHPALAIWRKTGDLEVIRSFSYEDFKNRLS